MASHSESNIASPSTEPESTEQMDGIHEEPTTEEDGWVEAEPESDDETKNDNGVIEWLLGTDTHIDDGGAMHMFVDGVDSKLPPIEPIIGKAKELNMNRLMEIIGKDVFGKVDITREEMREKMKSAKKAVITSGKTGETLVDMNKRDCNRHTFSKDVMNKMIPVIEDIIRSDSLHIPFLADMSRMKIENTHGDILYYDEDGFFEFHRDGDVRDESLSGHDQYSMILCIDSGEIDEAVCTSGSTTVCLPTFGYCIRSRIRSPKQRKYLFNHTFQQARTPDNFVIFPAGALHKSHSIIEGDFKLALKFDVFLPKVELSEKQLDEMQHMKRLCSCMRCVPDLYKESNRRLINPATERDRVDRMSMVTAAGERCVCDSSQCSGKEPKCLELCCGYDYSCSCACTRCILTGCISEESYCNHADAEQYYDPNDEKYKYYEDYDDRDYYEDEHDYYDTEDDFCNGYEGPDEW